MSGVVHLLTGLRIERVVTRGTFSLDGETCEVENNVWLVGDNREVLVIDAAHDAGPVATAVAGRTVTAIVCTHAHNDHIDAAPALADLTGAPVLVHVSDERLWHETHADRPPDGYLTDRGRLTVAGTELTVLRTPGHTWGSVCLYAPEAAAVFTGGTLFADGPGATHHVHSHRPTILRSIRDQLFTLPAGTTVHAGHGDDTTIGTQAPHLQDWILGRK
ncbi:MBL fold metallo-hydrolase [Streptomyces sp. NPDC057474]|uniref:MBL fold metallo-hydrolase n=1 Tax=Streptomyces sp. NPDC057474 TaxID=3346144 RepID=UPI00367C318F